MVRLATMRFCVREVSLVGNGDVKSTMISLTPAFSASSVVNFAFFVTTFSSTRRSGAVIAVMTSSAIADSSTAVPSTDGTILGRPPSRVHVASFAFFVETSTLPETMAASLSLLNSGASPPSPSGTILTAGAKSGGWSAVASPATTVIGPDIAFSPKSLAAAAMASPLTCGSTAATAAVAVVECGNASGVPVSCPRCRACGLERAR